MRILSFPARLLILVFLLLSSALAENAKAGAAKAGEVISVRGRPIYIAKGINPEQTLGPGDGVDAGDMIRTDAQSTAKILLVDDTVVDVHPSSNMTISRVDRARELTRDVRLDVDRGKVRAQINQEVRKSKGRFEIYTRAAYMGVEGTDFVVEVTPPAPDGRVSTTISVLEGQVGVGSQTNKKARISLTTGMRFTAVATLVGNAIKQDLFRNEEIQKLDKNAVEELAREARLSNETFLQSIALSSGPGRFGFSTLQGIGVQLKADSQTGARGNEDPVFKRRFRDTDLQNDLSLTPITLEIQ